MWLRMGIGEVICTVATVEYSDQVYRKAQGVPLGFPVPAFAVGPTQFPRALS